MRGLEGKGVLVTGGNRGIGLAAAERFLQEGSRVFICGIEPGEVETVLGDLRTTGIVDGIECDVSREEDVDRLVATAESSSVRSTSS